MKGLAPAMPGTDSTLGRTAFHSLKSDEYLRSSACAFVPRIFFFRSASNPLITESTTVRAQTPTATPAIEIAVMTTVAGRLRRCPGARRASAARACIQRPISNSAATTAAAESASASASVRMATIRFCGPAMPARARAT